MAGRRKAGMGEAMRAEGERGETDVWGGDKPCTQNEKKVRVKR